MNLYTTEIQAICPTTGDLKLWGGPHVKGISFEDAENYCHEHLGYCKVTGLLIMEIPCNGDDPIDNDLTRLNQSNMKDQEWSGLLKIPAEVVISELRVKAGQQAAYITELEDKLKERDVKNIKLTKLEHLEKDNARLTALLLDAQNRVGDLGKRNQLLEAELLKQLKQNNGKTT